MGAVYKTNVSTESAVIGDMEGCNSPPLEGDCPSFPICITDSPEVSPSCLLIDAQRSPFKTVSQGRKHSFRLV